MKTIRMFGTEAEMVLKNTLMGNSENSKVKLIIDKSIDIPANEIWYTTANGEITTVHPEYTGPQPISNVYSNGKGVMTFADPVTDISAMFAELVESGQDPINPIVTITLPSSLTTIGEDAFFMCESLTTVTITGDLTTIEAEAFYDCISLVSIDLPDTVTTLGEAAFCQCTALPNITLPASCTNLGPVLFSNCLNLVQANIPDGVTTIPANMFNQCYKLEEINIPSSVTTINERCFMYCLTITEIVIPDGVTEIPGSMCWMCKSLTSVVLPAGITSIGARAFSGLDVLESITFLGTVAQWNAITFGTQWMQESPYLVKAVCSDGEVHL